MLSLILSILTGATGLFAEESPIPTDTTKLVVRQANAAVMQDYAADAAFDYVEEPPSPSLFGRFLQWCASFLRKMLRMTDETMSSKWLWYPILFGAAVLIV